MNETGKKLLAIYDKVILFGVLIGLIVSFLLLNILVDFEKANLETIRYEGPRGPTHEAETLDMEHLEMGIKEIDDPFQVQVWTNRLMVPVVRVACVACERPIPYEAKTCPFRNCLAEQPVISEDMEKDSDLDGMPDWWEKKYGFDPFNPDDAHQDADGDGFTNLEEYLWGTDPRDPESLPPPVAALRLLNVGKLTIPLSFQGVSRTLDDDRIFTLRNNATARDYYVRLGDYVEGYKLIEYEHKTQDVKRPGMPIMQEDVSTLTLQKDNREYVLTVYRTDYRGEEAARLVWRVDDSEYILLQGEEFSLKKNSYKVVDINADAIIVKDAEIGLKVSIDATLAQPVGGRSVVVEKQDE